jgi:hypothetical protein
MTSTQVVNKKGQNLYILTSARIIFANSLILAMHACIVYSNYLLWPMTCVLVTQVHGGYYADPKAECQVR